jgi:hypothetical protein
LNSAQRNLASRGKIRCPLQWTRSRIVVVGMHLRGDAMNAFEAIEGRLASAGTLREALGASWAGFECVRQVADVYAARVTGHFATWMSVVGPACEGRDAVGFAPSMPGAAAVMAGLPDLAGVAEDDAARMVAAVAAALQERLRVVGGAARVPGDAEACARAADAAAEIRRLFAGV